MIDPTTLVNPKSTISHKQEFLLFCIFVAGRNADIATDKLAKFLSKRMQDELPFEYLKRNVSDLYNMLVANKVGQYTRIHKAISQAINLDVETCTLSDLLSIHGIGLKSAKFFLLYTREGEKHAVLDVNILKWIRKYYSDAPINTPPPAQYRKWEGRFLNLIKAEFGENIDLTKVDLLIWSTESGRL